MLNEMSFFQEWLTEHGILPVIQEDHLVREFLMVRSQMQNMRKSTISY